MRSPINLQWVHGGFRLPFGCVELCVVPTMGGNHRGVGETKEQTKCLSKLVKRLQVPKSRKIWCFCFTRNFWGRWDWYIYIDILIWDSYLMRIYSWDPMGGCFYHPLSSDSNLSEELRFRPPLEIYRQWMWCFPRFDWSVVRKFMGKLVPTIIHNHSKLTVFHGIPDKEDFSRFFSGFSWFLLLKRWRFLLFIPVFPPVT